MSCSAVRAGDQGCSCVNCCEGGVGKKDVRKYLPPDFLLNTLKGENPPPPLQSLDIF